VLIIPSVCCISKLEFLLFFSFISSSGCGLESFITAEFNLVISVFNKKEHSSVLVEDTVLGDGHWVKFNFYTLLLIKKLFGG